MDIKLLKKGMKIDGKYYPCHYSSAKNNRNGNATIYLKGYEHLPAEVNAIFKIENNTDVMTDYFEKDKIRVSSTNPYFKKVEELAVY